MRILVGDVGGTKTLLAVLETADGTFRTMEERRFESRRYTTFEALVREFHAAVRLGVDRACFGIAGPCAKGECRTPNLPWLVRAVDVANALGLACVDLINDFAAIGYGLPALGPDDYVELQSGQPQPSGPIGLIGAGTGLGEAFLLATSRGYRVYSSEGGHADFAAKSPLEWGLAEYLGRQFGRVSYERVLSGAGLANVFRYLCQRAGAMPAAIASEMERDDPAAVVARHGLAGGDSLAAQALELFASVYGAEAGNLALRVMATGGIYVGGGIAPKLIEKLKQGAFIRAFCDKGRLSTFVERLPVRVITSPRVALLGAAAFSHKDGVSWD